MGSNRTQNTRTEKRKYSGQKDTSMSGQKNGREELGRRPDQDKEYREKTSGNLELVN